MVNLKGKKRIRMHLADPPGMRLPSIEGLLIARRHNEYAIAVPKLIGDPAGNPIELESQVLVVPRERVTWYEWI